LPTRALMLAAAGVLLQFGFAISRVTSQFEGYEEKGRQGRRSGSHHAHTGVVYLCRCPVKSISHSVDQRGDWLGDHDARSMLG
jgi:hypothetical protein